MGQKIQFEGQVHEFPDEFTVEDISNALQRYESEPPAPAPLPQEVQAARNSDTGNKADFGRRNIGALKDDPELESFRSIIQRLETGGVDDPWLRTKRKPSGTEKGSSAYGPYQITSKLAKDALANNKKLSGDEQLALGKLIERQEIALEIGGRDRKHYEQGGGLHVQAKMWSRELGYETVEEFLDDFDYGGTLGLADDLDFQMRYETAARKLLKETLASQGGDGVKAAAVWHGGSGWQKAAHRQRTEAYMRKYRSYHLEGMNDGDWSAEDLAALRD